MTVYNLSQGVNTADTLTFSVTSSLATGTYSISGSVDNRPTDGTTVSFDLADLRIVLSSAVTPTAGDYMTAWAIPALDGTNYMPSTAIQPPASLPNAGYWASPVSTTYIDFFNIPMLPYLTEILILTKLTPTITISSAALHRRNLRQW